MVFASFKRFQRLISRKPHIKRKSQSRDSINKNEGERNLVLKKHSEEHSEPYQTSKMELFAKIVND